MAILKHIASKSSNYGAALEYLIFKHDELRKTPILDQNGNRIMRDEFYLDGLNCEPYSFDAACQQLNREYQKNKNKNEIKSHHYIISFDPRDSKKITYAMDKDLVDAIWKDRPEMSSRKVWELDCEYTGMSRKDKIGRLFEIMDKNGADAMVLTALDEIAWLLNLRGDDIEYCPVFLNIL